MSKDFEFQNFQKIVVPSNHKEISAILVSFRYCTTVHDEKDRLGLRRDELYRIDVRTSKGLDSLRLSETTRTKRLKQDRLTAKVIIVKNQLDC